MARFKRRRRGRKSFGRRSFGKRRNFSKRRSGLSRRRKRISNYTTSRGGIRL